MPLRSSDLDQAARYVQRATDLMGDVAQTRRLRGILELAIRRPSPGDNFVGDAAPEIRSTGNDCGECDTARCANGNWNIAFEITEREYTLEMATSCLTDRKREVETRCDLARFPNLQPKIPEPTVVDDRIRWPTR